MINLRRYLSTIKLPLTKPTTSRLNSKGKTKVPDQAPTPLSHLPPEIWLIIFSYEDTLTPADIRSIRLTSHFFSILSCARIFKKYYFDPFSCDGDEDINSEREEEMAFFTSELIAPCIKECILGPTSSLRVNQTIDEDHLNPLITHFFNTLLPKFVSLLAFTAKWIPFNDLALEKLCGMRGTLRVLDVDDCIVDARTLTPVERLGKLEVTNLTIRSAIHAPGPRDRGSVGWLEVLDLSHVKHIRVKVDNPELSHLRGFTTTSTPDPFSSSSSLEQTNAFFETLALLLKPAYNLETLHIKRFYSCREDIPLPAFTLIFPKLRTYRGPQRLFEHIKPGSELRSLTLKSFEAHKYHKPEDVERILMRTKEDGMRIGERLVELVVNVNGVPEGFLESIERECGRLRVLSIRAAQLDEEMVMSTIVNHLPPALSYIHIDVSYLSPDLSRLWWIKQGLVLKRNLFNNNTCLLRAKFTLCEDILGFDWVRRDNGGDGTGNGGKASGMLRRRMNSVAYVCGLRSKDPYASEGV